MRSDEDLPGPLPGSPGGDPLADLLESLHLDAAAGGIAGPDLRLLLDQAQARATAQALEELQPLTQALAGDLDLDRVVRTILDHAIRLARAERGALFLGDSRGARLRPALARNVAGEELKELSRVSLTILRQAAAGQFILTYDALHDPLFREAPSVRAQNIRMVACLPLRAAGRTLGVVYFDGPRETTSLTEQVRRALELLAGIAAAAIENARLHGRVLLQNKRLREQLDTPDPFGALVTIDPGMLELLRTAAQMARLDHHVLVLGESGVGKEMLAQAIHRAGPRAKGPLVAHNCANVPPDLAEDLFFGHARGGFTGAHKPRGGLFQRAHRGVLFLDEIGELSIENQAKLLRVVDDGVVRPVGSDRDIQVDVRIIAATSRDLSREVRAGRCLEALYFRICVLLLRVPPLRERDGDIPVLAKHFLEKHAASAMPAGERRFTPEALAYMRTLPWPGNVRTLETLVRRVLALQPPGAVGVPEVRRQLDDLLGATPFSGAEPAHIGASGAPRLRARSGGAGSYSPREQEALRVRVSEALRRSSGNKTGAARLLGCHRNTLQRWLRELDGAD